MKIKLKISIAFACLLSSAWVMAKQETDQSQGSQNKAYIDNRIEPKAPNEIESDVFTQMPEAPVEGGLSNELTMEKEQITPSELPKRGKEEIVGTKGGSQAN